MRNITVLMKKMSITRRLILYFSLLLAVQMILIGWFSFRLVSSYLEETYIRKMLEINNSIVQEINYIRDNGEELSDRILYNTSIQDLLQKTYTDTPIVQVINDQNKVEKFLFDPTNVVNTLIAGQNGILYQSRSGQYSPVLYEDILKSGIYKKSLESDGKNLWVATNENTMSKNPGPYLYVCRTIKTLSGKFKILGQLIIQMQFDVLEKVFKRSVLENGEYYAIIDNAGMCIYHTADKKLIGKKMDEGILSVMSNKTDGYQIVNKEKGDFLIAYSKFQGDGWNIIHALPMDIITSGAGRVRDYILLIMLLSLVILLPFLVFLSRNISRPIRRLKDTVETFGGGDFHVLAETDRMDEIGHLQSSFNTMAEDIRNLLRKLSEENKQRRVMELSIIEYQINPHFLYNSLDSINWMAQKAGNEDIEEMATALARFFRLGLSKGKEFYSIKDELEHARQYLLINKIRFKDSFRFEMEAQPEVVDYSTIKIILQPIVENAIKYGIDKSGTSGFIRVSVRREEASVLFEVKDNGSGIPKNRLVSIQNLLAKRTQIDENPGNGFGLFNVNQRIWLHFGDGYGITLESDAETGTTVRIRIPLLQ